MEMHPGNYRMELQEWCEGVQTCHGREVTPFPSCSGVCGLGANTAFLANILGSIPASQLVYAPIDRWIIAAGIVATDRLEFWLLGVGSISPPRASYSTAVVRSI